jgi:Ran GTPase-activating protein (RanGAP) involved in mRNA processing and transport
MLLSNQTLKELNLSSNLIGDAGATAIANVLDKNQTLERLSVRGNKIGNNGTIAFARKLPVMKGLKELIMIKNSIGLEGRAMLLRGIQLNMELEYLHVDDRSPSEQTLREIVHWIRLNCAGRRIFKETNLNVGLWPFVFAKVNLNPDVLFHFLNQKPEVFIQSTKKRKLASR